MEGTTETKKQLEKLLDLFIDSFTSNDENLKEHLSYLIVDAENDKKTNRLIISVLKSKINEIEKN